MNNLILIPFILGTLLLGGFAITIVLVIVIANKREEKERLERSKLVSEHQSELLRIRLDEKEQAMQIISGELHDNTVQVLGHARMYLFGTYEYVTQEEGIRHLNRLSELLKRAIDEIRHISHGLNSDLIIRAGLEASIEREVTYLREATSIVAHFDVEGEPRQLRTDQNLLIFRMIQESLQNIIKHSQATEITIMLKYLPESVQVVLKDNGIGFEVVKAEKAQSIGLKNMRHRARLLDATMDIQSSPGHGTTTSFEVRYPADSGLDVTHMSDGTDTMQSSHTPA